MHQNFSIPYDMKCEQLNSPPHPSNTCQPGLHFNSPIVLPPQCNILDQLKLIHRLFIKHMLQLLHKVTLSHSGSEKRQSFCRRKKCFVNQPALPAWADKNFKGSIKAAAKYQRAWDQKHEIFSGCFRFQLAIYNSHWSAKKWELKVWNIKNIYFKLYVAELMNFLRWKIGQDSETAVN